MIMFHIINKLVLVVIDNATGDSVIAWTNSVTDLHAPLWDILGIKTGADSNRCMIFKMIIS